MDGSSLERVRLHDGGMEWRAESLSAVTLSRATPPFGEVRGPDGNLQLVLSLRLAGDYSTIPSCPNGA